MQLIGLILVFLILTMPIYISINFILLVLSKLKFKPAKTLQFIRYSNFYSIIYVGYLATTGLMSFLNFLFPNSDFGIESNFIKDIVRSLILATIFIACYVLSYVIIKRINRSNENTITMYNIFISVLIIAIAQFTYIFHFTM